MDDAFLVDTVLDDGELAIRVSGELDMATADQLMSAVESVSGQAQSCVVDLSHCEFVDSSGIRALLMCQRRIGAADGTMRLVGVTPRVERVLRISGVHDVIEIGTIDQPATD